MPQEGGYVPERVASKKAGTLYTTFTKSQLSTRTIYASATNANVAHRYTTNEHTVRRTSANVSISKATAT